MMACLAPLVFLVLLAHGQVVVEGEIGEPCTVENGSGVLHLRHDKSGYSCCRRILCAKGTEPKLCSTRVDDTQCVPCGHGMYQDVDIYSEHGKMCVEKRCPIQDTQRLLNIDDHRSGPLCQCDLENGYYYIFGQENGSDLRCHRRSCDAGEELTMEGSCEMCSVGYFKSSKNYRQCQPITDCEKLGLDILKEATRTSDAECRNKEGGGPVELPHPSTNVPDAEVVETTSDGFVGAISERAKPEDGYPHNSNNGTWMKLALGFGVAVLILIAILLLALVVMLNRRLRNRVYECFKKQSNTSSTEKIESGSSCSYSSSERGASGGVEHALFGNRASAVEDTYEFDKASDSYSQQKVPNTDELAKFQNGEAQPLLNRSVPGPNETADCEDTAAESDAEVRGAAKTRAEAETDDVSELPGTTTQRPHALGTQFSKDSGVSVTSNDVVVNDRETFGSNETVEQKLGAEVAPPREQPPAYTETPGAAVTGQTQVIVIVNVDTAEKGGQNGRAVTGAGTARVNLSEAAGVNTNIKHVDLQAENTIPKTVEAQSRSLPVQESKQRAVGVAGDLDTAVGTSPALVVVT